MKKKCQVRSLSPATAQFYWLLIILWLLPRVSQAQGNPGTYTQLLARLDSSQQTQVLEGEPVLYITPGKNKQDTMVNAVLLFDCPLEVVWNSLAEPFFHKKYLDTLKDVQLIWATENQNCLKICLQWLFVKQEFQQISTFDPANHYYDWHLDPAYKNDISDYTGYWQLYAYDARRTLGEYRTSMSLGGMPGWLETLVKKEIVKSSLNKLKIYLENTPVAQN